ncbi:hypothetical protein AJ78_00409 [Emergomyces pasteurianus Ep9510]|uniref:Myb/SANT-like domain-containing protein n=1 Tax=Emergomyces pasteurianus Ep9510 TaxID=1447872 RepID=A0A1J9QWK3_9EURO|nr:hypothetical protein AJ78_00409 [Emergomyces pasteurianus Ep9510]
MDYLPDSNSLNDENDVLTASTQQPSSQSPMTPTQVPVFSTQRSISSTQQSRPTSQRSRAASQRSARQTTRSRTEWNHGMNAAMLTGLLDAKKNGWGTDNGNFKSVGWNMAVAAVKEVTSQSIIKVNCENRWRSIKRTWQLWTKHTSQTSGWTWDAARKTLQNSPDVMDTYFENHPEMEIFRHRGPANFELCEMLLSGKLATGQYATRHSALRRRFNQIINDDEEMQSISLNITPDTSIISPDDSSTPASMPEGRKRVRKERVRKERAEIYAQSIDELGSFLQRMNSEFNETMRASNIKAPERAMRFFLKEVDELLPEEWKVDGTIPYERYAKIPDIFANSAWSSVYLGFSDSSIEQRRGFIMNLLS